MLRGWAERISMTLSASTAKIAPLVGVVGPGLMGLGLAQVAAAAGFEVALCGRDDEASGEALNRLRAALERQSARGRLDAATFEGVLARVSAARVIADDLSRCALVIECLPEDRAIKSDVLRRIEAAVAPGAIIATNTSGLAISGLATVLRDRTRFLGLHFFSPAERMPLVEVVRGAETSEATMAGAFALAEAFGKVPVCVRDGPGFFATRVFAAYLDEAVAMVGEGAPPELIEAAAVATGRALGPLATLDETGLALNLEQARQAALDCLAERFRRPLAEPLLARLVAAGRGGRRGGGGFHDWPDGGQRALWPGLADLFPPAAGPCDADAVRLRLLAAEAREALRCLEEGVVDSADDADVASILGLGFPKRLGGVLRWAEDFDLAAFVALCQRLASAHGERFAPTPWLIALAASGQGLTTYRKQERQT
jgi:3-hydroxyacyl-CoA dehydrogenase